MTKQYQNLVVLIIGVLLLASYFLTDYLYEALWMFYLVPFMVFGLGFLCILAFSIIQKNKTSILLAISIFGVIAIAEILSSELFSGAKIFEATLDNDLSAIRLTLRDNNQFEVVASTFITEERFTGTYQISDGKIVFNDPPYDSDFIPDTLVITGDKIYLSYDNTGNPLEQFATFFDISKNEIPKTQ